MNNCAHCRRPLPDVCDACPACGAARSSAVDHSDARPSVEEAPCTSYVPIARFSNIAEAGYFHTELEGRLDCELRLTTHNDFDAATHTWGSQFVLSAPAAFAEQATHLLKELVSDAGLPETPDGDDATMPPAVAPQDWSAFETRIHWTPILLTLTAGTFIVWAAKQVQRHAQDPVRGGMGQVDLWERVSESSDPWIQYLDGGQEPGRGRARGRRELVIDRVHHVAILREDRDGDGEFERTEQIKLSATEP